MSDSRKSVEHVIMNDPINALPGDEPILKEQIVYETWRYAWARAVARAWSDDEFEARLLSEQGANRAMEEVGYMPPNGLRIFVKRVANPNCHWEQSEHRNGWGRVEPELSTEVTLRYPPRPRPKEQQALALADYLATGLTYPFTTS